MYTVCIFSNDIFKYWRLVFENIFAGLIWSEQPAISHCPWHFKWLYKHMTTEWLFPLWHHQVPRWCHLFHQYKLYFIFNLRPESCNGFRQVCIPTMSPMGFEPTSPVYAMDIYGKTWQQIRCRSLEYLLQLWHILITWPLASEWTLSYATPQCIGIRLTFYIIQVTWPCDVGSSYGGLC